MARARLTIQEQREEMEHVISLLQNSIENNSLEAYKEYLNYMETEFNSNFNKNGTEDIIERYQSLREEAEILFDLK